MGKAKKRSLHLGINNRITNLSREEAVSAVLEHLKSAKGRQEAYNLITLFGLSAEELLEAGASYETVMSLKGIVQY